MQKDFEFDEEGVEETLRGTLAKVYFRNSESGYLAGRLRPDGGGEGVPFRGQLSELQEGQQLTLTGRFEMHPRYGRQFVVRMVELERPSGGEAIEAYFASGLVKGVGPALAKRIVSTLGQDALEIIEAEPKRLREVPGIGPRKAEEIEKAIVAQSGLREVLLFLSGHGLSGTLAHKILKAYGKDAARLLKNNPYRLADDLVGVGFKRADAVAAKIGIEPDSIERKRAGLLHVLREASFGQGHCCLPIGAWKEAAGRLLGVDPLTMDEAAQSLADERRIVIEELPGLPVLTEGLEPMVYPLALHLAETGLVRAIENLCAVPESALGIDAKRALDAWQRGHQLELADSQREALQLALRHPFVVITGGPGVGKTTIVQALAWILRKARKKLVLAAPTGRAAKRLSEATEQEASTIHRLLEFQPGANRFLKDERNPIEADCVVIDETSMLDTTLAYSLLRAIRPGTHLVFVGDVDQLPSVGAGRVLEDLIRSGRMPVARLSVIYRQAAGSSIVKNAHRILEGRLPEASEEEELPDYYFIEQKDPQRALDTIVHAIEERIPQAFGLDPVRDVQVLCPMYRGALGVDSLNERLGRELGRGGAELRRGKSRYRAGDKILQIKNDYELELFNGDPGEVLAVDAERQRMRVRFGVRELDFGPMELENIVPAYAITVHRAQGSEYPAVLLPLDKGHFLMLQRRLLYTAVTRAKRLLVLVGSRWALERAVANDEEGARYTGLRARLEDGLRGDGVHPERYV